MSLDFTSVRNHNEAAVYRAVANAASRWPGVAGDAELLADVACVALNRLPPRYIRHEADYSFYLPEEARLTAARQVEDAVEYAFGYVQARQAMRARG